MLIQAVVVGRKLQMRGAIFAIGEQLMLDPDNSPQHREVIDRGWVITKAAEVTPQPPLVSSFATTDAARATSATRVATLDIAAPPIDKMLDPMTTKVEKNRKR